MRAILKRRDVYSSKARAKLIRQAEASKAEPILTPGNSVRRRRRSRQLTAYFDTCGICRLFRELDITGIIPAMCAYDYEMARLVGTAFSRRPDAGRRRNLVRLPLSKDVGGRNDQALSEKCTKAGRILDGLCCAA
jgi:hypothetical protein